jgi:hypothetical protein
MASSTVRYTSPRITSPPAFTDHFMEELRLERIPSSGVGAAGLGLP